MAEVVIMKSDDNYKLTSCTIMKLYIVIGRVVYRIALHPTA